MRRRTLAYSMGGDRCVAPDGKTLGLINASKPILGSYISNISLFCFFLNVSQLKNLVKNLTIRKHL